MKQSKLTGAISISAAQGITLFLGFITHPLIGRFLGVAPYGIYGIVLSVQSIIGVFLTLGVPSAVSKFVAQNEEHARSILWQALRIQSTVALILAGATAASAPLVSRLLGDTGLTPYFIFTSLVLFSQAFYPIFIQYLSGIHHFNKQALLTTLYAILKLAGSLSLLFIFGVYGALAGFGIGGIITAIIGWKWTRSLGGSSPIRLSMKAFLSFAGLYVLILAGLQALMSIDLFMVKAYLQDNEQVGYYNAAVTLSRISYFLLQGLTFIILPSMSALTKPGEAHDKAATFIRDTLRYLIALIIPSIAMAAMTSKELIILFFGQQYLPASHILTILIIGLGAVSFFLLLASIVSGAGKPGMAFSVTGGMIVASALLGTVLIPTFGLIGAAWQTTIASSIGLGILSVYTFRTFRIPFPWKSTTNIIIATAGIVAILHIWSIPPLLLPLQYLTLYVTYILILLLLNEVSPTDKTRVSSIHPSLQWIRNI